MPKILKGVYTNFLAYPIILQPNINLNRKKLQIFLEKNNIQTRPIFSGNILRHPAFSHLSSKKNPLNAFKNSDFIMKNGLLIGCHQGLGAKQINFIHRKIKNLLKIEKNFNNCRIFRFFGKSLLSFLENKKIFKKKL